MTVVPHTVTVTRTIGTSREAIYAAWTEPDRMRQWFATVVDADVRTSSWNRRRVSGSPSPTTPRRRRTGSATRPSPSSYASSIPDAPR